LLDFEVILLPTFTFQTWPFAQIFVGLPGFVEKFGEIFVKKRSFCPKMWPFAHFLPKYFLKSGHGFCEKMTKNRLKMAKKGLFWAIFADFRVKFAIF
jgi:hypothetical protein